MARAAEIIEPETFDILDINMGCPVPKVFNNQEGSALMKDPALIERIVAAAAARTSRPVTVKIRRGIDEAHQNAVECALAAQEGGASAVAVHGRTRVQMYSGKADWEIIARVREALRIPVIGNGDHGSQGRQRQSLAVRGDLCRSGRQDSAGAARKT